MTPRHRRKRLERGVADGDLPEGTDTKTLAAYLNTVPEGMSIEARDGATRAQLERIVDCAMAARGPFASGAARR